MKNFINVGYGEIELFENPKSLTGWSLIPMNKKDRYGSDDGIPASVFEIAMWRKFSTAVEALSAIANGAENPVQLAKKTISDLEKR